ncbi:MAG: leucyl aminopeptidase family protein [Rickettsiales bacterium]
MPQIFTVTKSKNSETIPIVILNEKSFPIWLKKQQKQTQQWLKINDFKVKAGNFCLIPKDNISIGLIVTIVEEKTNIWSISHLPTKIPEGSYAIEGKFDNTEKFNLTLGWALASYKFSKYKKNIATYPKLVAPKNVDLNAVKSFFESICWARDLINTPANDMTTDELANEATSWAKSNKAKIKIIKGENLLKENYPMIYTVGKASSNPPYLVDINFPRKNSPKITLVGKGVTFDTGGLDIKPTSSMRLMKKDMGGAANILALAKMIIDGDIPVQLRVLLPIAENSVAGNAMRPLDIVKTRKGISVEIGNTDAEGRLILCDALFEADKEKPDLLIDCATLTGAARVALGTDIPAFFTNDDKLATKLSKISEQESDPLWRLPLWADYREYLSSKNADISNDSSSPYGGAITAALYLQEFVDIKTSWLHIDMMAWNLQDRAGRPQGGEAMGIRALYRLIKENYGNKH